MEPLIIFDDGRGQLGPMTDLRAVFELRTGMFTTAARLAAHRSRALAGYWVPQRLVPLLRERGNAPVNTLPGDEIVYCANGRWGLPDPDFRLRLGEALVEQATGDVVAALLRRADAEYLLTTGQLGERVVVREHPDRVLYRYPWDILALMDRTIPHDIGLTRLLDSQVPGAGVDVIGDQPLEVHKTAVVHPRVVFDTQRGPIVVHEHAVIRPGAVICGPASIGNGVTVIDRALIKANTVIGPGCKVGGEVGATIFQGHANKAHDGHLGDSWVGKWVNIGAGTSNSNLLNTYGDVTMRIEPDERVHRTGMTFLGAIIGDHAKFAINSSIATGTVVGTGAMIACRGLTPKTVRRFAWLTERGEQVFRYDKMLETMRAMMARRDRTPTDAYLALVHELYRDATEGAPA